MFKINKIYLILIAPVLIAVYSCSDFLDLKPVDNLVQEEFWQSKEQVNSAIAGCYASMNESGYMDRVIMWGELRAEMMVSVRASSDQQNMLINYMTPTSSAVNWASIYKTINFCNTVLHFAKTAQDNDPTFTDAELKMYEGEALAIRALSYFFLVRNFKEVPLVLTATLNDNTDFYIPKSTEQQILNQIITDLKSALTDVPAGYSQSVQYDKGRITKGAVLAMLADVYLWDGQYDNCIDACNSINRLNKYELVDGSKWFDNIFFRGNSTEGIFELQFNDIFSTVRNFFYNTNPTFKVYTNMPELFLAEPNDVRADRATFDVRNNLVFKYAGVDPNSGTYRSDQQFYNNWIFYRYSDVLLMEAEGYLKSSTRKNLDSAYYYINLIHERATANPLDVSTTSEVDLEEALLLERQIEFAYEGKRWYDLLRFARRNNFEKQQLITEMALQKTTADNYLEVLSYYSDTSAYFLPIYQEEINLNPNLIQNPYYY
jgi:hypothetical protein